MTDAVNQNNFSNFQTYNIDIDQVYKDFVIEIDKIRSHVRIENIEKVSEVFDNSFIAKIKVDQNPQESRCHAFYRYIGLPVVAPDGSYYNPGFDRENNGNPNVTQKQKEIANKIDKKLYKLFSQRERNINQYFSFFSIKNINSIVLAISSTNIRRFSAPFEKNSDPFDSEEKNQSYSVSNGTSNNNNCRNLSNTADLLDYMDENGNKLTDVKVKSLLFTRSHILKPLMVDPRVDKTVSPYGLSGSSKIISVPFAKDKSQTFIRDNIYATRPVLEIICRQRLDISQIDTSLTQRFQDAINYVKNEDTVKNEALLQKVFQGVVKTKEEEIFVKNLNIIRAMIDKLVESLDIIILTEDKYHWMPLCNSGGPEYGSKTANNLNNRFNYNLNTEADKQILELVALNEIMNINNSASTEAKVDLGNFAFSNVQPLPDASTTTGFGNSIDDNLKIYLNDRDRRCARSNDALREIEIIMGEFSGLGLADIMAIYTALWTVDRQVLVSLLDDQTFTRMYNNNPQLRSNEVVNRNSGNQLMTSTQALTKLEEKIKEIFNIMDKLFQDRRFNGRTTSF